MHCVGVPHARNYGVGNKGGAHHFQGKIIQSFSKHIEHATLSTWPDVTGAPFDYLIHESNAIVTNKHRRNKFLSEASKQS